MSATYYIRSWSKRFGGKWVVFRSADNAVMTENLSVYRCLEWVSKKEREGHEQRI